MFSILASCALYISMVSAAEVPYTSLTLEQLRSMTLLERVMAYDWKFEYITLGFTFAFVLLFKVGDYYNERKVSKFLQAQSEVFTKNFAQFGVSPTSTYVKDLSEAFSAYATGRQNIAKVDFTFKLAPRHNAFVWILESILGYFTGSVPIPHDRVDIVITPSAAYDNFINAVVSKLGMNDFRKFNYFLSLTKTSDSSKLPESFVFMSEANEFQDKLLTEELRQSLKVGMASFLRFIAFTDQPIEKPTSIPLCQPRRKIIISSKLVTSSEELAQLSKVVNAVFKIVDKLAAKEILFEASTLKKVVKTRENEISKIKRVEEEVRAEIKAEEQAKIKREEQAKLRTLSAAEQEKLEKKNLEKQQKKMMKKQKVRM